MRRKGEYDMSYLMRDVPATRYQLLDRPGTPYPAGKSTPAAVTPNQHTSYRPSTAEPVLTGHPSVSTEEQLKQYLLEAYGTPQNTAQELCEAGHPQSTERW